MTFTIHVDGHDDLEAEAKAAFENGLVSMVTDLVQEIKSGAGVTISRADVTTNTTGTVDANAATEGNPPAVEEDHPAEDVPAPDDTGDTPEPEPEADETDTTE